MNQKWYINSSGVKVKPCAVCKISYPCTSEFYKIKRDGNCYAYCHDCDKKKSKAYQLKNKKTNQVKVKNIPFIVDGIEFKRCTGCNNVFPNTFKYFDRCPLGQSGLHARCRDCRRKHTRSLKASHWQKPLLRNAKSSTRDKQLEKLNIDENYILGLWEKQNGKCYWTGISMIPSEEAKSLLQPSLDRIDRRRGYIEGNVVLCCFVANFGRNENTEDSWKQFLKILRSQMDYSQWEK